MSSSVFKDFDDDKNVSGKDDDCEDEKLKLEENLVILVNKNGKVSVDERTLHCLLANETSNTSVSIVSVASPTPSMQEEMDEEDRKHLELSDSDLMKTLTEGDDLSSEPIKKEPPAPRIGVTVENYYSPAEAKNFVKEVLTLAGIDNPIAIDYEFQRFVIQNDHCYTSLLSPVKEKPQPTKKLIGKNTNQKQSPGRSASTSEEQHKDDAHNLRSVRVRKPSVKLIESISTEKEPLKEPEIKNVVNESIAEQPQAQEETGSEYESEMSESSSEDNDKDSDLDFDINRLNRPPKKGKKKKKKPKGKAASKNSSKIAKKRHSKSVDSEMENILRELDGGKEKKMGQVQPKTPKKYAVTEKKLPQRKVVSKGKQPPGSNESPSTSQPAASTSFSGSIQPTVSAKDENVPNKPDPPKVVAVNPAQPTFPKKEKKKDMHLDVLFSDMSTLFSKPDKIKTTINKPVIQNTPNKGVQSLSGVPRKDDNPMVGTSQSVHLIPEEDKQLELINSIVQKELNTPIPDSNMPEELPNIVKLLEAPGTENIDDNALLETLGESLPEDFLQHVAELAENKEIQEIIDKQVLGVGIDDHQQQQLPSMSSTPTNIQQKSHQKQTKLTPISLTDARKHPMQVMRSDGRIITLPPIEVPTTRAKKRAQTGDNPAPVTVTSPVPTPEPPAKVKKSDSKDGREPKKDRSREQSREKSTSRRSSMNRSSTETRRDSTGGNSSRSKRQITNPAVLALLNDNDDSESGESWNSEDDPDRLWCICRQPHNNRFMICCDVCEDWFHGKCVNITKAMGKQMEEQGKEWTCPNCIKKKREKEQPKITSFLNESGEGQSSKPANMPCIVCKKPARAGSIYCSEDCIGRHAQNALVSTKIISPSRQDTGSSGKSSDDMDFDKQIQTSQIMKSKHDRVIVFEKETGRCLAGSSAPTVHNLKQWLKEHPTFQVVTPGTAQSEVIKAKQKQLKEVAKKMREDKDASKLFSEPAKIQTKLKIGEHQRLTISSPKAGGDKPRKLSLTSPPPTKTPSTPQASSSNQPKLSAGGSSSKSHSEKKLIKRQSSFDKQKISPGSRSDDRDHDLVRQKSREGLQTAIEERIAEIKDEKAPRLNKEEILKFAEEVENELYLLFNRDCGMKYRAKYRSLVFNIKDKKNLTLFRKICEKNLKPFRLVRMEPQELASQELAQWRENENKHQLEMIKKSELELLACSKNYVLKTHKGEEVVESKTVDRVELDPTVAVEDVVKVLNNSSITSTSETKPPVVPLTVNKDDSYYVKSYTHTEEATHSSGGTGSHHKDKKHHSRSRDDKPGSHKHKRKHSRSRDREDRHKSHEKKSKHDKRSPEPRHEKKEKKHEKRELEKSKRIEKEEKDKKKVIKEVDIPTPTQEDYNLIDKILEGSHVVLDRPRPTQDEKANHEKSATKLQTPQAQSSSQQHESDQEPTSTVTIPTPPDTAFDSEKDESSPLDAELPETIWSGTINMIDVASCNIEAQAVSGDVASIAMHLPDSLEVVGRIPHETVWDYIGKIRKSPNKEIIIIRFSSPNDIAYLTFYKYYELRRRLGVIKVNSPIIKDFYILPLAAEKSLPSVLLPIKGVGFVEGKSKPNLLLGVIVKIQPDKIRPAARQKVNKQIPLLPPIITKQSLENIDPSFSVTEEAGSSEKSKRSKLLSLGLPPRVNSEEAEEDEPYSPGAGSEENDVSSSVIVKTTTVVTTKTVVPEEEDITRKMEEINRQIQERKMEIAMLKNDPESLDEPYSPSRPVTPPAGTSSSGKPSILPSLDKIAIPSNLSEILASIKSAANISTNTITTHEEVEYDPTSAIINTYSTVSYSTANYSGTISESKQEHVTDLDMADMNDSDSNSTNTKRRVINIDEEPGNEDDCFEIPSEEGVKRTRWENSSSADNITDEALLAEAAGDLDLRLLGNQ